ncbi:MAG: nucleoside-diphosphate kinase [Candidatus Coatesbacteria bacterium]|nr:MAG: nucleoside-diphosphate kinase [Candidatus Coatesbacteria bacterium]
MEKTLFMIKPDATARGLIGELIAAVEREGFVLERLELQRFTREKAEAFYDVHRDKPFFGSLVEYITSGPVVPMVLAGEGVIAAVRELMGATDPAEAASGTIRRKYGESIERNACHGSDSPASAAREIAVVFGES